MNPCLPLPDKPDKPGSLSWYVCMTVRISYFPQEGHRQAIFWGGGGDRFQRMNSSYTKQEPTIDLERFTMIFRYLSPWGFGEHGKTIAMRAFKVCKLMERGRCELWGGGGGGGAGGSYGLDEGRGGSIRTPLKCELWGLAYYRPIHEE